MTYRDMHDRQIVEGDIVTLPYSEGQWAILWIDDNGYMALECIEDGAEIECYDFEVERKVG